MLSYRHKIGTSDVVALEVRALLHRFREVLAEKNTASGDVETGLFHIEDPGLTKRALNDHVAQLDS